MKRVGFALVGVGQLTEQQLLPAFRKTPHATAVALVTGHREHALAVGRRYGIAEASVYGYDEFERLADDDGVDAVYIVLPNGLHAEYTVRAARCGKHVLCEKPMATRVADAELMIQACRSARRKLMVAYRCQYAPADRAIADHVRAGRLGELRDFCAFNGQVQQDPSHWRLKRELAGGGPLPDIGIYCLNAARFLSGEEPVEVMARTFAGEGDPRFAEVEESVQFLMRFPGGMVAHCGASYATHTSRMLRLSGTRGWAELDPAFGYSDPRVRLGEPVDGRDAVIEPVIENGDPFAHEIEHFARCILDDLEPHTPGEEGLQDLRVIDAIYASARSGTTVALELPGRTRGPQPEITVLP